MNRPGVSPLIKLHWSLVFVLAVWVTVACGSDPGDAPFTFHGSLVRDGLTVSDSCDFRFSLWDAKTGGAQVGDAAMRSGVAVIDGVFVVPLSFGAGALGPDPRWITIEVRCPGDAGFELSPTRKPVRPSPTARVALDTTDQVPQGVIAMWSGNLAEIPDGWALCDGTNGTPDLRDRFVLGIGEGEQPGTLGGAAEHTHQVESHSHTVDPIPTSTDPSNDHAHTRAPHTHTAEFSSQSASTGGTHSHALDPPRAGTGSGSGHAHSVSLPATATTFAPVHGHGGRTDAIGGSGGKALFKENRSVNRSHSHSVSNSGRHSHTITIPSNNAGGGNHDHSIDIGVLTSTDVGGHTHSVVIGTVPTTASSPVGSAVAGSHAHSVDLGSATSTETAPVSDGADNRPPYFKVAFVMKVR